MEEFPFLGDKYPTEMSCQIADADIHPVTYGEFDLNFAEGLTYVPVVPLRTNSILANARQVSKPGPKPKYPKESSLMNKFLKEGSKRHNPYSYEYRSLKDGERIEMKVGS